MLIISDLTINDLRSCAWQASGLNASKKIVETHMISWYASYIYFCHSYPETAIFGNFSTNATLKFQMSVPIVKLNISIAPNTDHTSKEVKISWSDVTIVICTCKSCSYGHKKCLCVINCLQLEATWFLESQNLALTGRNDHSEAFTKNSFTPSSDIKYEKTLLKKSL